MAKEYHTYTSDSTDDQGYDIWTDKIELDTKNWKVSSGKLNTDNVSINNDLHLPNVIDNILFFDKTYLVIKIDEGINSYKIGDKYDIKEIQINDSYSTEMNCKNIEFEELPKYIRDSVLEEEI